MRGLFRMLLQVFLDQRADDPGAPAGDGGKGAGPAGDGKPAPAGDGAGGGGGPQGDGSGDGQGQNPPLAKTPKYGDFGESPAVDDLYNAHLNLKNKTTATERNFAALRKTIEGAGFRTVQNRETGEWGFEEVPKAPAGESKKRFQDSHRALFEAPVLQAVEALIQDYIDDRFNTFSKTSEEQRKSIMTKATANRRMTSFYPALVQMGADGKPNPDFNQEFYDLATEIWQNDSDYKSHPKGELWAAQDAAVELGISFAKISEAKKEGYDKGVAGRKVLGPVDGGQKPNARAGKGTLSKDDYLKLSPEDRDKYDKEQVGV